MGMLNHQRPLKSVEADFGEGPITIHWRKMSLLDMDKIQKAGERGQIPLIVETLFVRARTAAGTRLWPSSKRQEVVDKIMTQYNPDEVGRVVVAMSDDERTGDRLGED